MNLSDLKRKEPLTAWFSFDEQFSVCLKYIDPAEVRKIVIASKKFVNGREEFDEDKALINMAERIVDWKGLTVKKAGELMALNVPEEMENEEVPCHEKNKIQLIKESWTFKPFIETKTVKLPEFIAYQRELERKNSGTSRNGASAAGSPAKTAAPSSATTE